MPPAVAAPTSSPDALLVRAIGVRQLSATIFNYTIGSGMSSNGDCSCVPVARRQTVIAATAAANATQINGTTFL